MDYVWIVEINSFCIVILGIILYSLYKNYDRQTKQRYYMKTILSGIGVFAFEIIWALIDGKFLAAPRFVNFCVNGLYEIASVLMAYYWLCYVEYSLESSFHKNLVVKYLSRLPIFITVACVVVSYFNGFFFYITADNMYARGRFIILHVILCQMYTVITTIHAVIKSIKCSGYLKAMEYRILSMFLFFPLAIGIIQIAVPNIPSVSVGVTLAFLFVYIDLQNLQISVDTLSGLNNRNQLLRYLGARMKSDSDKNKLYVFMLDVNKFKKINDTYGHVEGDAALIRCAKALKTINKAGGRCFIGRYGGDEFIIIADLENDSEAEKICNNLTESLAKICEEEKVPYDLTFSYGYATYSPEMKTMQSFIAAADKKLYEAKKRREAAIAHS